MKSAALPRIVPFAVYLGFIGIVAGLRTLDQTGWVDISTRTLQMLYPLKLVFVTGLLIFFWRDYSEVCFHDLRHLGKSGLSILLGLAVFFLWINMDWLMPGQQPPTGFDPDQFSSGLGRQAIVISRVAGAALMVPVMEELFWRSFLLRYIIDSDFTKISVGQFSWTSFLIGAGLFGLEHHFIIAGIMAGLAYALLLYKTRSIAQCILAHAVTNFALGIYVLQTGKWYFW
ncbi:MAG: CAAX prenyl protease-related protein [Geopsychrobacter sp.]|nr:CAAX prenyl protease-related protein [Geopsychrobacter sp.]